MIGSLNSYPYRIGYDYLRLFSRRVRLPAAKKQARYKAEQPTQLRLHQRQPPLRTSKPVTKPNSQRPITKNASVKSIMVALLSPGHRSASFLQVPRFQPLDAFSLQAEVESEAFFEIGHVAGAVENGDLLFAFGQLFLEDLEGGFIAVGDENVI
jgi:hypothetical protein